MNRSFFIRVVSVCLAVFLLGPLAPASASVSHGNRSGGVVVEDLVPALSPTFAPWTCRSARTGPVCRGERHLNGAWEPAGLPCAVPVWNKQVSDRTQTRYYDHDNLNYFRRFRTRDVDYFSTSPTGEHAGSVSTRVRFFETFGVRGDDKTITVTTKGILWDVRTPEGGRPLFRVVGTLVEPYNAPATFSGVVMLDGVTTHYRNVPLSTFLNDDMFLALLCRSAIG